MREREGGGELKVIEIHLKRDSETFRQTDRGRMGERECVNEREEMGVMQRWKE